MCSHDDCRVEVLSDGQVDEYHEFTEKEFSIPWGDFELRGVQTICSTIGQVELPKYNLTTFQVEYLERIGKFYSIPQKFEMGGSDGKSGTSS